VNRSELADAVRAAKHLLPHRATVEELLDALAREIEQPHTCQTESDMLDPEPECHICGRPL
jgi:recombinational DNA repair protein RecR